MRIDGLPEQVTVYEVGPRDGLQNEPAVVPLETKLELICRLVAAGLKAVEVTSLVRPDAVPQLADAEELLARLPLNPGVRYPVLVPNRRGLDRALALGVREIAAVRQRNRIVRPAQPQPQPSRKYAHLRRCLAGRARKGPVGPRLCLDVLRGSVGGDVDPAQVVGVATELMAMGCQEVSLGDTIGVATPGAVSAMLSRMVDAGVGLPALAVHFHDTYGQALANTLEALRSGLYRRSTPPPAGSGVAPLRRARPGTWPPKTLSSSSTASGSATGVDLAALARTSLWLAEQLGRPSPSRTVQALASSLGPPSDRDHNSETGREGTGSGQDGEQSTGTKRRQQ